MKKIKYTKGEFEYPIYQTKVVIIRTIIYFLLSLSIFIMGYYSTKTTANLLTIVAVFGFLPSSKSLVSVIMYLRIPKFSKEIYNSICKKNIDICMLYSLYLTSYKENFPINCFVVRGNNIIGYTEFSNTKTSGKLLCKVPECEEHIKAILKQNGIKNMTVKIFTDLNKFENRIDQLQQNETTDKENEVINLLCDISL